MKRLLDFLAARSARRYVPSVHQVPGYRMPTTRRRAGGITPWVFVVSLFAAFATGCLAASENGAQGSTGAGYRTSECSISIEAPADAGINSTPEM